MPRTDQDEVWRRMENGQMELVSRTERIVPDEEVERDTRRERMRALARKQVLTNEDVQEILKALVRTVYRDD